MSIVTTYTCDKCGAVQFKPEQFWRVAVTCTAYNYTGPAFTHERHWCRKCCEKEYLLCIATLSTAERAARPELPPTFEDLVRQIVREEVQQ